MLSIKPIGSTSGQVSYYVNLGREDYYVSDGEAPAVWWGSGASHFGLHGVADRDSLRHLLLGVSPDGSNSLVQNARQPLRRAAFDLSFSPPKSVDAVFSQGSEEQRELVVKTCEKALHKTLAFFERRCGLTRRGRLGLQSEPAGLVGVVCRHDTSRGIPGQTPDPNLHWHVVVCNLSVRRDGTTGAFDARSLFEKHMKMCLGAMFRAEVAKELDALGLSCHRPKRDHGKLASWFELDAVPPSLVEAFSSRRREIEKWLRLKGLSGAKASEMAALATRHAKEQHSRDALFREWRKTGLEHHFTECEINELLNKPRMEFRNVADEAVQATERAIIRITEDRAHFSEIELLRLSAEEAQGQGVGIAEVVSQVRHQLEQSTEIVRLGPDPRGVTRFTTKAMLQLEEKLFVAVEASRGNSRHRVQGTTVAKTLQAFPTIRVEQAEAVRHLTCGSDSIAAVNGWAGTGKTFMLSAARACWEAEGMQVIGTALAANAAKNLAVEANIDSVHVDRLFWELERGIRELSHQSVVVLDEAGMLGTKKFERLVSTIAGANAKLVLVGDVKQLQPINAGAPLKAVMDRLGYAELAEITRQRALWAREAVVELAVGKADDALGRFDEHGLLTITQDRDEACKKLVADWGESQIALNDKLILAGTRAEIATMNRLCQTERLRRGEIRSDSIRVGQHDLYGGDRVIFRKNNNALLLKNGSKGTVLDVCEETNSIRVRLDDGFDVAVGLDSYAHIQPAYAVTVHTAQGQTVEQAFVLLGGLMSDRELAYVQASRSRGATKLYCDLLTGGPDVHAIAQQLSQSRAKDMAHDYLQERAG